MKAEPLSPTSTIADVTLGNPRKIRLPSGYTLLAFEIADGYEYNSDAEIRVSVYPPESDCVDADDRVAELLTWRDGADVLLKMYS